MAWTMSEVIQAMQDLPEDTDLAQIRDLVISELQEYTGSGDVIVIIVNPSAQSVVVSGVDLPTE